MHDALTLAYEALNEKGYKPIPQLTGFIFSGDGSYITTYNNARTSIEKLDREETLNHLLSYYLEA
ncbi:MAG: IreB family regulatory phosphoprotein [Clostridia bacterium]|nr:IreB family regulatory phosphoprotein [Clostridia bacterium]